MSWKLEKPKMQQTQTEHTKDHITKTLDGLRPAHHPKMTVTHPILIPNVLVQMKNDNKSEYTINFTRKALKYLDKHANLNEPEAVKALIASLKTYPHTNGKNLITTKRNTCSKFKHQHACMQLAGAQWRKFFDSGRHY